MDWTAAIDHHRTALIRVVGVIAAMAGFSLSDAPQASAATLPRRLHRAVLAMLRPAEAAARRLIVIAARGLALPPRPAPSRPVVDVVWRAPSAVPRGPRAPSLALLDTLRGVPRRPRARARAVPRIRVVGVSEPPLPLRAVPRPDDPLAAAGIRRRLTALSSALGDLPRQARRFARWRGRRDAAWARGRRHRFGPLRPGRPPGWLQPGSRHAREVHKTLDDLHGLAFWALAHPDSS